MCSTLAYLGAHAANLLAPCARVELREHRLDLPATARPIQVTSIEDVDALDW